VSERTTTDWDARKYDRLAAPQEAWARLVLERLPLEGGEVVLDAGCGSGGDLLELTPDLIRKEAGTETVDAVFSNATFHWIEDHRQLFERLCSVLRPGGRLVAQCGGRGNVEGWTRATLTAAANKPFAEHVEGFEPWNFYGPEETEERLREAGFEDVRCWLEEMPVVVPDDPLDFVSVVGLAAHYERLPQELHEPFRDAVLEAFEGEFKLRYVRLNIEATRPA
jgi:trans-aconitate 2-methyltransferase